MVNPQTSEELIASYFGDIVPENDLQRRIMHTYAQAFEKTYLPESERPSGKDLLSFITSAHPVAELFSHDVLRNARIANKVRNLLASQDLEPDPEVHRNERVMVKLAHVIYPGDESTAQRNEAVELCRSFCEAQRSLGSRPHGAAATQPLPTARLQNTSYPPHVSQYPSAAAVSSSEYVPPPPSVGSFTAPHHYAQTASSSGQIFTHPLYVQPMQASINALYQENVQLRSQIAQINQLLNNLRMPQGSNLLQQRNSLPLRSHVSHASHANTFEVPHQPEIEPVAFRTRARTNQAADTPPQEETIDELDLSRRESSSQPSDRRGNERSSDSNVHHHINVRFKNRESKYSGTDEEHLQDYIDAYLATSEDYKLTPRQKLQYLHNLFRGDALRFYNANVRNRATAFGEAISMIFSHFNSPDVQQRVKADLSTLSLKQFAEKEGSMAKGLSSLAAYIANRVPQCPPCFRSESNKVDFLKQAVLDQPWAREILVRIKPSTEFQPLYTELANALQLNQEVEQRTQGSHSQPRESTKTSKPFIYFTQPRTVKSMAKAMFPGNDQSPSCWNCGRKGHRFSKCHKKIDLARIAARKAEHLSKKGDRRQNTKRVLYELVSGLNDLCQIGEDDDAESDVVKAFFGDISDDESDNDSSSSIEGSQKDSMFTNIDCTLASIERNRSESDQDF